MEDEHCVIWWNKSFSISFGQTAEFVCVEEIAFSFIEQVETQVAVASAKTYHSLPNWAYIRSPKTFSKLRTPHQTSEYGTGPFLRWVQAHGCKPRSFDDCHFSEWKNPMTHVRHHFARLLSIRKQKQKKKKRIYIYIYIYIY